MAEKVTVPDKPLAEVAVNVTAGMVPAAATDTTVLEVVSEKLGHVPPVTVTISGEVIYEPFDAMPVPVDVPASPDISTGPMEPW